MIRWAIICLCMLFPLTADAQQVAVQTGEHTSFTRVVVTIPPGTPWRFGRNDGGYLLRLPGVQGYDLRRFFDLIPRTRIEDASTGTIAGELQFDVRCTCYADVFLDSPSILVIDIRDGAAPDTALFEAQIDPQQTVSEETLPSVLAQPYELAENRLLPVIFPPEDRIREPDVEIQVQEPIVTETVSVSPELLSEVKETGGSDLLALERSITESLSRGLSQGVLDAEPDLQAREADQLSLDDVLPPGLQTRTGIDLTALPSESPTQRNQAGHVCQPDHFFDVGTWGNEGTFSEQMGVARANLTGEFDRLDETAVTAKAQLFVFFGFGREAIQTLQLDGALSQERQYLTAIAQIIDGDTVAPDLFLQQVSCQSPVALWAMLANGDGALDGKVDPASVLRAFKALPTRLQSHLGPSLSDRFLAIGDEESALQALAPASAASSPTVDAQLAETALLKDLGETDEAIANLTELARTDAGATPETMIAFFSAVESGEIDAQDLDYDLADVLRFESAMLPISNDLGAAQARALIAQDQFDQAQALIQELSDVIEMSRLMMLIEDYAVAATERMPDADFLEMAFDASVWPATEDAQNEMARRLLGLGFPDQALLLINGRSAEGPSTDRTVLRAEIALMRGNPESALDYLDDAGIDRDDRLRLAALDLLSGTVSIPDLQATATNPRELWRRGEWVALSTGEDQLLRDASVAVLEQNVETLSPDTPLESSRMLLGQSAESRAVVDELLERFVVSSNF